MSGAINILMSLALFLAIAGAGAFVIVGLFQFLVSRYLKNSDDNETIT